MVHSRWRRFLPKKKTSTEIAVSADPFVAALERLGAVPAKDFEELDVEITRFKREMNPESAADWLVLLLLQSPRAAHAQSLMDEHPHGYHDREKRLYELIDFNDTFVSAVLQLSDMHRKSFTVWASEQIGEFCKKMYSKSFSNEQFDAIRHGLSREIAVYLAAERAGFNVTMTSRTADAFGVDMQIQDPASQRYINIDCKTSSAFYFRLKDLVHQHRIESHDMDDAEGKGWWEITNHGSGIQVTIVLLRVSQEDLGEIIDFEFSDEAAVVSRIRDIIRLRSNNDGQYGRLFQSPGSK